jgi:hypothetical protein
MARYRLYHLEDFRLTGSDEIEAANDGEAAAIASRQAAMGTVELWCGARRVRTIDPAAAKALPAGHQ